MNDTMTELEQIKLEDVVPYEDNNDPNHRTHIVHPPLNRHIWRAGMTSKEIVDTARLTGQEVVCLCGHRFVPKSNPDKYDVCDQCMKIAGELMRRAGE